MPKSSQTRIVGMITNTRCIPTPYFSSNSVSRKNVGMHLVFVIIPTILVCELFGISIPTYISIFKLFFTLVSINFFYDSLIFECMKS